MLTTAKRGNSACRFSLPASERTETRIIDDDDDDGDDADDDDDGDDDDDDEEDDDASMITCLSRCLQPLAIWPKCSLPSPGHSHDIHYCHHTFDHHHCHYSHHHHCHLNRQHCHQHHHHHHHYCQIRTFSVLRPLWFDANTTARNLQY